MDAVLQSAPTFAAIASALREIVEHDARVNEIAEPFLAGLPAAARGIVDAHLTWRARMALVAEAERLFRAMAPCEAAHRRLIAAPRA